MSPPPSLPTPSAAGKYPPQQQLLTSIPPRHCRSPESLSVCVDLVRSICPGHSNIAHQDGPKQSNSLLPGCNTASSRCLLSKLVGINSSQWHLPCKERYMIVSEPRVVPDILSEQTSGGCKSTRKTCGLVGLACTGSAMEGMGLLSGGNSGATWVRRV